MSEKEKQRKRVFVVNNRECFALSHFTFANQNYNHGHNILELYNVFIQTRWTTSKTKRDI